MPQHSMMTFAMLNYLSRFNYVCQSVDDHGARICVGTELVGSNWYQMDGGDFPLMDSS